MTRRDFTNVLVGGFMATPLLRLGRAQKSDSRVAGVRIGVQSYSFRDRPLDGVIAGLNAVGVSYCELWSNHLETNDQLKGMEALGRREARRKWRLDVPLDFFKKVRARFDTAGITLTAYNLSFGNDWTEPEIARGFEMARALGVDVITASSQVSTAAKVDPFARKSGITVAFHNHSTIRDDEFARPEDFATALKSGSDKLAINLDIGHFTAANFDALDYLDKFHDRIVSLHVKDRGKNQGRNLPFGQGDTPIVAVLRRLRDRKWDIPAQIEFEYNGDPVAEVRKSFEFCKNALLT